MEKDRLLDSAHRALILTITAALLLASCTLPRVRVLNDPLTPEEHINLGLAYERRGEFGPALEHYGEAAKTNPLAFLYLGNAYYQTGNYDDAELSYRKAISETGDGRAYNNLAWMYYSLGVRLEEAERLAAEAVRRAPASPDFRDTLDKIRSGLPPVP